MLGLAMEILVVRPAAVAVARVDVSVAEVYLIFDCGEVLI